MNEIEWLQAKARDWRAVAAGSRDPDTIRILLSLADLIEAEIAEIETANSQPARGARVTEA